MQEADNVAADRLLRTGRGLILQQDRKASGVSGKGSVRTLGVNRSLIAVAWPGQPRPGPQRWEDARVSGLPRRGEAAHSRHTDRV